MKFKMSLLALVSLMLLTACETIKTGVWYPPPFKFQEETKKWLKESEAVNAPPIQAINDFDKLSKRERAIEANRPF